MDTKSQERLSKVHPALAERVTKLIAILEALGYDARVVQGLRTFAEQDALYNQPHDRKDNDGDGKIDESDERVTNAKAGQSNHNFGLAADISSFIVVPKFATKQPNWNDTKFFRTLGAEAKKLGLEWGGDWHFTDLPHVQLRGLEVKDCLAIYNKGGLPAVWQRMNQILGSPKPNPIPQTETVKVLKKGDKGEHVREMQNMLVRLMEMKEADGVFGAQTEKAVKSFQSENGLTADGVAGEKTLGKLREVYERKIK